MKIKIKPIDEMEGNFDQFIGIWENFVPSECCIELITKFEELLANSLIYVPKESEESEKIVYPGTEQFPNSNIGRKDESIFFNAVAATHTEYINSILYSCLNHYQEEYGQLRTVPLISYDIKAQKTKPGGGYHMWHYENSSFECAHRELVWMIYLNDIDDGEGETEFLYQKKRIKPTRGTVVIWPAGLTHVHRGNPVYTSNKYILTGWFLKS